MTRLGIALRNVLRIALILALLLPGLGQRAGAQSSPIAEVICEPTDRMIDRLQGALQSTRQAVGMRSEEQLMEVWTDPRGDWTLVVSYAHGTSCIVAMGQHWQPLGPPDGA